MNAPLARAVGVSHGYRVGGRSVEVLDDVSVDVLPGEVVALSGRSGSGKSTLCHLLAGIERPRAGEVSVLGRAAADLRDWSVLAFLPQRLGLAEELTVEENALLPALAAGAAVDRTLLDVLDLAAIAARAAGATSLGEQQRVGIARALALWPRLAVLDEPTGHQDDARVERVLDAVRTARERGCAVVVATHDDRLLEVADRVVELAGGRVVVPAGDARRTSQAPRSAGGSVGGRVSGWPGTGRRGAWGPG